MWVTAVADTTLRIDFDGDGISGRVSLVMPPEYLGILGKEEYNGKWV